MLINNDENYAPSSMAQKNKSRPTSVDSHTVGSHSTNSDESIRSARAIKVFGDLVGNDESSLCYSPSPYVGKSALGNLTNVIPAQTLPFGTIEFTPQKSAKKDPVKKANKEKEQDINVKLHSDEHETKGTPKHDLNVSVEASLALLQKKPSEVDVVKKHKSTPKRKATHTKYRVSQSSLTRKKMITATQDAINLATQSVNQTLNSTRIAKKEHTRQVSAEVAKLKEEWLAEKEEAAAFFSEATKEKRELLDLRKQLWSQYTKVKVDHERSQLQLRLHEVDKEIQFKSDVFVDHQKKLKENEDRRRRMSVELKNKIRKEKVAVEDRMRLERIEERHENLELQWAASRDANKYRRQCEQERRESFAFRNALGRRQRQEDEERKFQEKKFAHERFELKLAGERDADEYKKKCKEERRVSFEFRNAEGRHQRQEESERLDMEKDAAHERFKLKMAGESDADEYKKQCAKERRDSFAFRNVEGRRQRQEDEERVIKEKVIAHENFELKMAAERDVDEYLRRCEKARRESFVFRGHECIRHREVMEEISILAKEKEHEFYILNWAAQDDVKEYLAKEAKLRRESFAFRNQEGKKHREVEEEIKHEELQKKHEQEKMNAECQKDVEAYKKKCAERDRASLCYRGKELHLQRLHAEEEHQKQNELDHERHNLEGEARSDVDEYVKECKRRRRLSLAFRAKERRRHANWEKTKADKERERRRQHSKNMTLDQRYVELAKERERTERAINKLKHAGCSFSMNPFAPLLD